MTFDPTTARPDEEPQRPAPTTQPKAAWSFDPRTAVSDDAPPTAEVMRQAVKVKPDAAAEADRLARRYPVPYEVVKRNADDFQMFDIAEGLAQELDGAPTLAGAFRNNLRLAEMAHDDIDVLGKITSALSDAARYVVSAPGTKRGLAGDVVDAGKTLGLGATVGVGKAIFDVAAVINDLVGWDDGAAGARQSAKRAGEAMDYFGMDAEGSTAKAVKSGLQSAGTNLAMLPLGLARGLYATASQAATTVAGLMGLTVGADAYNEARDAGKGKAAALAFGIPQGVFEFVFEKIPASKLFGDLAANAGLMKTLKHQAFSETWTEQMTTLAQDFNSWMNMHPEKTLADFIAERPEAAYQTMVATLVGVGVQTSTIHGINKAVEKATDQRLQFQQDAFEQLQKLAAQSALRERSPEQFRALMAETVASSDAAQKSIHVDAQVLAQLSEDVLAQLPEQVRAQIPAEAAKNGTVEIPMADVLTVAPGTPLEQILNDHARMTPEAMSRADAQAAGDQSQVLRQEAEKVIQQAQDQQAAQADYDQVQQMYAQQITASGRYRPAVAEQMGHWLASFYTAYGSRSGMTATEMQARYPVRVAGVPSAAGGQVMDQGQGLTVEGYHFSAEDRPTITTAAYGTGLKGSNRDLYLNAEDQRLRKRTYFYADKGTGIRPESGVGGRAHRVQLANVYDSNRDPLGLKAGGGGQLGFESRVLDAGFSGYLDRLEGTQPGQVVMLGDQTFTPELLGAQSSIASGSRVPAMPRTAPTWENYSTGTPEQMQALMERLQSKPAWGGYDFQIADGALQYRKKQVLEQKGEADSSVKLPKKAAATTAVDLRKGPRLTGKQKMSIHDVAAFFDKITGKRDFNDPKEQRRAVKQIVAEIEFQLQQEKSGLDWYEDDIGVAFRETAKVVPSLATSAVKRQLFAVVAGLQSPGTLADLNWDIAAQTFEHYEKTGTIPGRNPANGNLWAGGPVSANKEKALNFLNNMVQDLGEEGVVEWLYSEHTVKELNEARKKWGNMGPGVNGKMTDTKLGMFAFGPKVGPFVMNINGIHELTVDVWATRTLNRLFGQMTGPDGKIIDAPTEPQRRVAKEIFNAAAEQAGVKPYQVQSVLWFFEQQLFNHLGTNSASLSFSDGARKFTGRRGLQDAGGNGQAATGELTDAYGQDGNREGRYSSGSLAPLEGAPNVAGAAGPDARLVAVAEQYARDNGIDLRRQGAYVQVDPERAARIAAAYEAMEHAPNDPAVREAYDNLAQQTLAQYLALQKAGYQFYLVDETNDPYAGNPWNAMRDLRANQRMGVFATEAGFGTSEFDPAGNPLLADTGLEWGYGSPDGPKKRVLFNDLFRAVHDAFGHGLEGAGFRAQGEENAWQAHVRLFTGSAVGAITSETRGQNSWLNYGPHGEANRTAKVEDTVFADQKTGLMPSWTWTEGRAADEDVLEQKAQTPRGTFNPATLELVLNPNANLSTFFHETGHFFLEVMADIASQPNPPAQIAEDMATFLKWAGIPDLATWNSMTLDQKRQYHERWAESIEQYVMEGKAPSVELQPLMRRFASWLKSVYGSIKQFLASRGVAQAGGQTLNQADYSEALKDENGKPITLYHGTNKRFKKFNPAKGGTNYVHAASKSGIFFTSRESFASAYAEDAVDERGGRARVIPVHLKAKNPLEVFASDTTPPDFWYDENFERLTAQAKKNGNDAIIVNGLDVYGDGEFIAVVVVFDPKQIISAISGEVLGQDPNAPASAPMQLNDDIRRVMDRMLATDAQIAQANEVSGMLPDLEADALAAERLNKRSMADLKWAVRARDAVIAKLRKQARTIEKGIREQVTVEVNQMPEVQAKDTLAKSQKENGGKLNDTERAIIADAFGYESVDAMLQAIDAFGSKADVIDGMTQQRMLQEHGDLTDEDAIRQAALEAVHNDARARALATELRTQREMLNPRQDTGQVNAKGAKITVNALVEAAKQFAANVVASTPLRDLKSKAWQHTAAERRAGTRWQEATAAGKTQEAVQAKQDQMLNNAAAKAALDAREEMGKILEFFKRAVKGNDEKVVEKGRDPDVVNAARAVLAAYGIETPASKGAAAYLETLQRNDPDLHAVVAPMVEAATRNAQPIEALTFAELQALHEEVAAMWHLAKRSRQMEVDGDLMDIEDAAAEVRARMEVIGIPDEIPGETGALTKKDERARWLQFAGALLRRVEQWAEGMDGKFGGPFLRYVYQPVKEAANRYRTDKVVYRKKFQALVDNVAPLMTHQLIAAPELNYTFGKGHNGIGHAELLHALLHTGNESNKRKLLLGRNWAVEGPDGQLDTSKWDAFIARLVNEGVLQSAHYDFAQGVWDLLEETKPLAQKAHRDVFGRYFAEVTADPFTDPWGQARRGGYVPAQADPNIVDDANIRALAERENENMAYSFPTTNKGFTKSRVEYNRPLKLDLRTIPQHIDKVLLFSHMEPAVRGVSKLLRQKTVSQALGRIDPSAYSGMLLPWLNRSAKQIVETPTMGDGRVSRVLSTLRSRAGAALMFANISNTVQQLTGFSSAAVKVKPAHLMRATAQMIAHPKQTRAAVAAASEYMATRMDSEIAAMTDAMNDILLKPSLYEKSQAWAARHSYFLQSALDNSMSPAIWTGAYNQALEEKMSDADAVRFADSVVRQTQGANAAEDVSRIETGPAYARLFTQFIGYFNMLANTNGTALKQIAGEMGLKKGAGKALGVVFFGMLAPIWVAEAIAQAFRGGPDDKDKDGYLDDWLAAVFGMGTIKGLLAQVPFVAQAGQLVLNRFNTNPADDRFSLSPAVSLLESAASTPNDVYKLIMGEGNAQRTVRDAAALASLATGLPATALARPLGYAAGVADNKIQPTGPADAARGAVTGTASPESKVK